MVGVTLRQNRSEPLDRNTRPVDWTAARPVSGTPAWALPAEPGRPRPTSPFEPWHLPPEDPDPFRAKLRRIRAERLSPYPKAPHTITPMRAQAPAPNPAAAAVPRTVTVRRRAALLLGLAYFLLTSFASGLAWTTYLGAAEPDDEPEPAPPEPNSPPRPSPPSPPAPPAPPSTPEPVRPPRHPHDPGFHVRPDGSTYLIIPLPPRTARPRTQARV